MESFGEVGFLGQPCWPLGVTAKQVSTSGAQVVLEEAQSFSEVLNVSDSDVISPGHQGTTLELHEEEVRASGVLEDPLGKARIIPGAVGGRTNNPQHSRGATAVPRGPPIDWAATGQKDDVADHGVHAAPPSALSDCKQS